MQREKFAVLAVFCAVLFYACADDMPTTTDDNVYSAPVIKRDYPNTDKGEAMTETSSTANAKYEDAVHKADFTGGDSAIVLGGLDKQSVYLVTVNTSGSPVDGDNTGGIVLSSLINANMMTQTVEQAEDASWLSKIRLSGGAAAQVFDTTGGDRRNMAAVSCYTTDEINNGVYDAIKNGRLIWGEESSDGMNGDNAILRSVAPAQTKLVQSESLKTFWVQNEDKTSSLILADLAATGTHCKIWVKRENYDNNSANGNDGKITSVQAQDMADKFDAIYGYETAVFGYEYGGGVPKTDPTYGGLDKDPKIQILVYDIYDDGEKENPGGTVVGYFFSADQFRQSDLDNARYKTKSNEAEMFYIDAFRADDDMNSIYSTLVHEFQHMIHFHRKTMSTPGRPVSSAWFNEMLSMIAEDLIDPLMGINIDNAAHPASSRIPTFLENYNSADPTVWQSGYDVLKSYAASYALGAYLVRNFGGVGLVKELISNGYVDTASIDTALRKSGINPVKSVTSFTQALSRFGEALLFTNAKENRPAGVFSFNNTVESYVGSTKYTFDRFDIYTLDNEYNRANGPLIWGTDKRYSLHPRTLILQTNKGWQSQTGTLSITLSPPSVKGIDMYIIVK
ncbi:MAG: hypothetical protein LBJ86_00485 [Spirochaetaceae bacterium]|nr:hypothetical protein [Spirochaetaceae bacterium]